MAARSVKKQKEKENVCVELKHLSPTSKELVNEVRGIATKPDCTNELHVKVAKAIEVNNLSYDCETGFHYMKQ